jgi:hypothetical protein
MFFDPATGWRLAAEVGRSWLRLTFLHALPLLLVGCVAEGYGMLRWGRQVGAFGAVKHYAVPDVVRYEAVRFGIALVLVLAVAALVRVLANTFHARNGYRSAFTVAVFGLGPVLLLRIAEAFPAVNPWVSWGVGAVLAAGVLYQGIPRVLHADPAHAIGLYLSSAMLMVLGSGLAQLAGQFAFGLLLGG